MRSSSRARWLLVAAGLCCATTVLADHKHKPASECTSLGQVEHDDGTGVDLSVASTCDTKMSCGIKWTLTCAPHTKHVKRTQNAVAFDLDTGQSDGTTASSVECGNDAWEISEVTWSCAPSK
jgi:hypothetical protein